MATTDWLIARNIGMYPLHGYPHPYLFHVMRVHSRILHRDMMRIGSICVDLDFTVQLCFKDSSKVGPTQSVQFGHESATG